MKITYSSTHWYNAPLSGEMLFSDPNYLRWARGEYGDRVVAQEMLAHQKAHCKERKIKYCREEAFGLIADRMNEEKFVPLRMREYRGLKKRTEEWVRYTLNRSSRAGKKSQQK